MGQSVMRRSLRSATLLQDWGSRLWRRRRERHGLVLMYHRVAEAPVDPWHLAVGPAEFKAQLESIGKVAEVVPLAELQRSYRTAGAAKPVVSITFDDGYLDNLEIALPLLEAAGFPATVFVPTAFVGQGKPFWWDRLAWIVLGPVRLPDTLVVGTEAFQFRWEREKEPAGGPGGRDPRSSLHLLLWSELQRTSSPVRDEVLDTLAAWSGHDVDPRHAGRPMNPDELRRLTSSDSITIGGHSHSHRPLTQLSPEDVAAEVEFNLERCAELIGHRPETFSYPHGATSEEATRSLENAGIALACTSRKDLAWEGMHPLAIPRVSVPDRSGPVFDLWLRWYWLP